MYALKAIQIMVLVSMVNIGNAQYTCSFECPDKISANLINYLRNFGSVACIKPSLVQQCMESCVTAPTCAVTPKSYNLAIHYSTIVADCEKGQSSLWPTFTTNTRCRIANSFMRCLNTYINKNFPKNIKKNELIETPCKLFKEVRRMMAEDSQFNSDFQKEPNCVSWLNTDVCK